MRQLAASTAVIAILVPFGISTTEAEEQPIVARVGAQAVTAAELQQELERQASRPGRARGDLRFEVERAAVLDDLVERKLLFQAAVDAGYLEDPEIRRAIEGLLIQHYRSRVLEPQLAAVDVTDDEVRSHYEQHRERYRTPASRRAAVLQLEGVGPETVARAKQAAERARELETTGFGAVAAELSFDRATRYRGGDMGELREGVEYRWPQEVVAATFAMSTIGEISAPIEAAGPPLPGQAGRHQPGRARSHRSPCTATAALAAGRVQSDRRWADRNPSDLPGLLRTGT